MTEQGARSRPLQSPRIKFDPPLYIQRYVKVYDMLEKIINETGETPDLKTVLEVGCAELGFHRYVRNASFSVQKIIYLDKDEKLLEIAEKVLRPISTQHLRRRETPLTVEAYAGCITKCDPKIFNADPPIFSIIAIELIEHLDPDILVGFEKTVFGLIRPPLVIITTPNAEFNSVFGLEPGKFRHPDHRFEWTRQEFGGWCQSVCSAYPAYTYSTEGIGGERQGPSSSLGHPSQMAIFRHTGESNRKLEGLPVDLKEIVVEDCYKLMARTVYPFYQQPSTVEERVLREVDCFLYVTDLHSCDFGFERTQATSAANHSSTIDLPLEVIFKNHGFTKGLQSIQQAGEILQNAGYEMIKAGPRAKLGIRVPKEKKPMKPSELA